MFVADSITAQVVIRERVEVDPAVTTEGPTSNVGSLPGWYFEVSGTLRVDFGPISFDTSHCSGPTSNFNPRLEFRMFGARDTVITVPLGSYITNEFLANPFCDFWITELEGVIEVGEVAVGDIVETVYLVHGYEVPLQWETFVPDDTQDDGSGTYTWAARNYLPIDEDPHFYETLDYTVVLEQAVSEVHHLFVAAEPDTLRIDESALLSIQGRAEDETPVAFPAGATLDLALDQGGGTVGFLRWNEVEGVVLAGVPEADIEAGLVEVVASEPQVPTLTLPGETSARRVQEEKGLVEEGQPPVNSMDGETLLTVTAALTDDPSVAGSATVTVLPPGLQLTFALNGNPVDPAEYLPTKDDILEVTARLVGAPPGATGNVTFTLPQADEFEFDGVGGSGPEPVALQNGEATILIKSLTWWGVATVQADYELDGFPLTVEQQIPVDMDGDTIADAWEMLEANGGRLDMGEDGNNQDGMWDEEDGPGAPGDNVTKLGEYMGLNRTDLNDDNLMEHIRLSPRDREVLTAASDLHPLFQPVVEDAFMQLDVTPVEFRGKPHEALWDPSTSRMRRLLFRYVLVAPIPPQIYGNAQNVNFTFQPGGVRPVKSGEVNYDPAFITMFVFTDGDKIEQFYQGLLYPETPPPPALDAIIGWNSVAVQSGLQTWVSYVNGTDIDGNGPIHDIRIFDLLADQPNPSIATNDAYDRRIAGLSLNDFAFRVMRHEVGHAVGIAWHPTQGSSVLRIGIGPAKSTTFTQIDLNMVDMHLNGNLISTK